MKMLVIGGTSGIGRQVVEAAMAQGHSVRAMGRSAQALPQNIEGLEPFTGDALKPRDMRRALQDVDAVVVTLGIEEGIGMLWQEVTLFSRATEILLRAMRDASVSRLIVVTGFGAGASKAAMSMLERAGHRLLLGKIYEDKDRQEAILKASDLDWTIVRPTILTNGAASDRYRVLADPDRWRNGLISRADVARFIIGELKDGEHVRGELVLTR